MKRNFSFMAVATIIIVALVSCNQQKKNADVLNNPSHVEIKAVDGKYNFFVDGEIFDVKGVGGGGNLALLHESGGNALRTWGPNNAQQLLDTAKKYNLMIAMGLGMGQELHGFDYNDTARVGKQFRNIKKNVETYKNHPNLLCWVVGNELNIEATRGVTVNIKVYDALNDVVKYIHETDPNHPVTTAIAGISRDPVQVVLNHCPDLDFIALQVYGSLGEIPVRAKAAGINKPYIITEYGPVGHWEMPTTEWGREIEETSARKASGLWDRIQRGIVTDSSGLNLGGFAFIWGQKQERTPTWYGMFLKSGEAIAVVDELTRYWTGKYPENRAPEVDSLKLDGKNAVDNIYVKPGKQCSAKVYASDPDNNPLIFKWVILKEVTERSRGGAREIEPDSVPIKIISETNGEIKFISPADAGEYRLFSYVFDGKNKVGTANVPFYVK